MRIQSLISAGFTATALASASIPAFAWTVWPDVDFEWYANVGKPVVATTNTTTASGDAIMTSASRVANVDVTPPTRVGHIWSPGHWETKGTRQVWMAGHFIKDDYYEQVALYNSPAGTMVATGPTVLRDAQGNIIPTSPEAYPVTR